MARPKKERVICSMPKLRRFCADVTPEEDCVVLTLDEYEVIRLHDFEHWDQATVAAQMLISRPTVTALLNTAHEKIADVLINGKTLEIRGGNCRVCEIGSACDLEKSEDGCQKRHKCKASCRTCCGKADN